MDIDHSPSGTLIREFYSNLSVHSNDSNTQFVKSWIRDEKYVITSSVVAFALRVPKVQHHVCLRYNIMCIRIISLLYLMTLCHI